MSSSEGFQSSTFKKQIRMAEINKTGNKLEVIKYTCNRNTLSRAHNFADYELSHIFEGISSLAVNQLYQVLLKSIKNEEETFSISSAIQTSPGLERSKHVNLFCQKVHSS